MQDVLATTQQYRQLVTNKDNAHYALAQRYTRRHMLLGVPVVITTAVVSTATFASLQATTSFGWQLTTGLLAVGATVMASLQTFFNFAGQAQQHLNSAVGYSQLRRKLEQFELRYAPQDSDRKEALADLAMLTEELDRLESSGSHIPDKLYSGIRERYRHLPEE